jgi:hypothetical protein
MRSKSPITNLERESKILQRVILEDVIAAPLSIFAIKGTKTGCIMIPLITDPICAIPRKDEANDSIPKEV